MNKYKEILSIGHRCTSQIAINNCFKKIQKTSPFSWVNNYNAQNIIYIIENEFLTYLNNKVTGNTHLEKNLHNKMGSSFGHYNMKKKEIVESFNRKIKRFLEILKDEKNRYLFIYINEDYLYNEDYRNNNDENYENLRKLNDLLINKYPELNFDILNICFKKRENYKNIKNIYYNIKFKTINREDWMKNTNLRGKIENIFRKDCGIILSNFIKP